jgi:hypothetical protein
MLNLEQVKDIEQREAARSDFMKAKKRNWLSAEESAALPQVTNDERSAVEVFYWLTDKPEKYFVYISAEKKQATTWTGETLGNVSFGREYRGNMGDKRQSVRIYGTNGRTYAGTYYKRAGDYARIKALKQRSA